ncbi:MAG: beta-ketoacyl synthase [Gammaproteobacteria bacterium]|nr:beta-ketoacyl synthase [Gammaproteobacteria bacterium]
MTTRTRLPVIAGFGGINPAGRVSFHHAYRRLVIDALSEADRSRTYQSLARLMNLQGDPGQDDTRAYIDAHTLVRRIEAFDVDRVLCHKSALLQADGGDALAFTIARRHLPDHVPDNWQVSDAADGMCRVSVTGGAGVLFPDQRRSRVSCAGQVPSGFDPGALYQSRNHPRGLQLTVFGASDALRSMGIDLDHLKQVVAPDEFAVYSGSAMGQLDAEGYGGLLQNTLLGKRPTSKNVALGLNEMPGDFVNAYVMGSVGGTAGIIGACATFLYAVRQGVADIQAGRKRVVLVGNAEAPVVPEVIEGYRTMGALAEDDALMALDGRSDQPDHRRACRPFSDNCGFTVAEGAVYAVLMDDELAVELGARILGSVPNVFVNADGYKKSIPGPGIGNYLTMAKAMGLTRAILGEAGLRHGTYVQAHGTGTPQNRVTESHILNELARINGIERLPVGAVKAYVGHSMAPAGGDQLSAVLGLWEHGWLPGITTISHIAEDVHDSNLHLPLQHVQMEPDQMQAALINSKGFGGNNATGVVLSPARTRQMLEQRWGKDAMRAHARRAEATEQAAADYDAAMDRGEVAPIYQFGEGVLSGTDLEISTTEIRIPGFGQSVRLDLENPFGDMTEAKS